MSSIEAMLVAERGLVWKPGANSFTSWDTFYVGRGLRLRLIDHRVSIATGCYPDLRAAVRAAAERAQKEHLADVTRVARRWRNRHYRTRGLGLFRKNQVAILAAKPSCVYCGRAANTVDHVVARRRGGTHDMSNLAPACHSCNSEKGELTVEEWSAYRRSRNLSWPPERP